MEETVGMLRRAEKVTRTPCSDTLLTFSQMRPLRSFEIGAWRHFRPTWVSMVTAEYLHVPFLYCSSSTPIRQ